MADKHLTAASTASWAWETLVNAVGLKTTDSSAVQLRPKAMQTVNPKLFGVGEDWTQAFSDCAMPSVAAAMHMLHVEQ